MSTSTGIATDYSSYIHFSRYARWIPSLNRRETWEETVDRYINYFDSRTPFSTGDISKEEIREAILNMDVMPSMRCLMTAGPALDKDNVAGFNCSYLHIEGKGKTVELEHESLDEPVVINITSPIDWDEAMYVLMCGTGVGFSVERQFIGNLPKVGKKLNHRIYSPTNKNYPGVAKEELSTFDRKSNYIMVADSKYGWASALRILIVELYNGNFDISWDVSLVRAEGEKLKTFGGRASGPKPLVKLFKFAKDLFLGANTRRLTSVECHDLMCKVAEVVVVGGVRRSALISLSNLSDSRMRVAKSGNWWEAEPQRALANNSVAYTEKPDTASFLAEWSALYASKSGERGIFSREAAIKGLPARRKGNYTNYGTNPCSEIVLRSKQFCNLTEAVVREGDSFATLSRKIEIAAVLGTYQSTLTDFVYLSKEWSDNTKEEALLGVSLTGIMDHSILNGEIDSELLGYKLTGLKHLAVNTNAKWAKLLKVNPSKAVTCVDVISTLAA